MLRLFAVLVLSGASVQADITYYFGGTLSSAFGTIPAGTPFNGSFSYAYPQLPTDIIDRYPYMQFAEYILHDLNFSIGSEQFRLFNGSGEVHMRVGNKAVYGPYFEKDVFQIWTETYSGGLGGEFFSLFRLDLTEDNGLAFSSTSLPSGNMRVEHFTTASISFGSYFGPYSGGNLTYLIPEPSSLSLLLAGGAVLMAGRRRSFK